VGETLKELRKEAGLTLRQLAQKTFLHWSTLGKIEQGQRSMTSQVAEACDKALSTNGLLAALVMEGQEMIPEDASIVRIAPERYFRPHNKITYIAEAERAGRQVDVELETTTVQVDERIAERLGVREGDLATQTRYLIRMNGMAVTSSVSWEPLSITGGTEIERPHEGPYADKGIVPRFDAIGYNVTVVEEVLDIRMPHDDEPNILGISTVQPVVEIKQTFLSGETPIETADIVFPANRYQLHYRMEIK
jgi:GntR family transcriptional regulator